MPDHPLPSAPPPLPPAAAGGPPPAAGASGSRVPALDGLRGLAALTVFLHHTLGWPTGGFLGVDLFFVLSGLLITSQLLEGMAAGGRVPLGGFWLRRVLRLGPGLICTLGLYAAIGALFPRDAPALRPWQVVDALFLTNWHLGFHDNRYPTLAHLWSLCTEWQFYLLWPLLLAVLRPGRRGASLLAAAFILATWAVRIRLELDPRMDGLAMGGLLAVWLPHPAVRRLLARRGAAAVLVAAGAALGWFTVETTTGSWWMFRWGLDVTSVLAALVVAAATAPAAAVQRALGNPVLRYFGRISYGFYLYHFPLAVLMYVHGFGGWQMLLAGTLVTLPLADWSWRFVERPVLRLGRGRLPAPLEGAAARKEAVLF